MFWNSDSSKLTDPPTGMTALMFILRRKVFISSFVILDMGMLLDTPAAAKKLKQLSRMIHFEDRDVIPADGTTACKARASTLSDRHWMLWTALSSALFSSSNSFLVTRIKKWIIEFFNYTIILICCYYPTASKASRGSKFNWKKNSAHPLIRCQRMFLSITNFDPQL